jgi:hypothetical protein
MIIALWRRIKNVFTRERVLFQGTSPVSGWAFDEPSLYPVSPSGRPEQGPVLFFFHMGVLKSPHSGAAIQNQLKSIQKNCEIINQ